MMGRMAGDATDVILQMHGVDSVHVLRAAGVAVQAPRADLLRRCALEGENLGLVSSAIDVGLPGTVTAFASLPRRAFLRIQSSYKMRGILKMLEEILGRHVCVAGFAGLGTNVERWIRRPRVAFLIRFCTSVVFRRLAAEGDHRGYKKDYETDKKDNPGLLPLNTLHRPSARTPKLQTPGSVKPKTRFVTNQ